jgi:hypothetical protein
MVLRFIFDDEGARGKNRESFAQQLDGVVIHQAGRTFLNGLTVTFS